LTAHVGGHPNTVQKALIERAARLTLYIELMDAEALAAGTMSERNSRMYLAWVAPGAFGAQNRIVRLPQSTPSQRSWATDGRSRRIAT
jgi:hypothetical protein